MSMSLSQTPGNTKMDRYFVLGNPIAHSKSPEIHARFAQLTRQTMSYERQLVALDDLVPTLARLVAAGVKGCNVTVPFKFEAFAAAAVRTARAELAAAANTLSFNGGQVQADNTDGAGLVRDIQDNAGVLLADRDVLLIGAGGAAAGVLAPLLLAAPRRLVVANRTVDKAHALVARHQAHPAMKEALAACELHGAALDAITGQFDVVINASASSLGGAAVPVAASVLRPGALVYDMMYGPAAAPMLAWATAHGAQGRDGLGMLVEQAAEAFFVWRGLRPPAAQVLQELRH